MNYRYQNIEPSRIATFDIFSIGLKKHHVAAMLEFDVTASRSMLREQRKKGTPVSFNAWLIKVIGSVLKRHPEAAGYLDGKKKLMIFNDINVSMLVEKKINDARVPFPLVIEKVNEKTALQITEEIERAKKLEMTAGDIVLQKKSARYEKLYYHLPSTLRRLFWIILLRRPRAAFKTLGNVSVTSVGMMGKINGWFIHRSVHPLSFGVGSVLRKPVVLDNEIRIREVLNMTILVDHDVIDGAPMVRFLNELTEAIENGLEL